MIGTARLKTMSNLKVPLKQILVILSFLLATQPVCIFTPNKRNFKLKVHSRPHNTIVGVSSFQVGTNLDRNSSFHFSAKKMSRGFSNSVVLTQNSSGVKKKYCFFFHSTSTNF